MKTKNLKAMCVGSPRIFTGWNNCQPPISESQKYIKSNRYALFFKKETLDDIWIGVCILIIIASHSQLKWLYHLIFPISVIWAVCFSLVLFAEWKTENSIKNVMLHILKKNKGDIIWLFSAVLFTITYLNGEIFKQHIQAYEAQ